MNQINYPRANVYDIRSISSPPDLRYYLDTNVLIPIFARPHFRDQNPYQIEEYPRFFRNLIESQRMCFTFSQNLIELVKALDSCEDKLKEVRSSNLQRYLETRRHIYNDINSTVKNIFQTLISAGDIEAYFSLNFSLDINDFIFYSTANDSDVAFLTDDYEFIYLEDINVFTANRNAVSDARRFGKLVN